MTNIGGRREVVIRDLVTVPLRGGSATRRDLSDLLFFADQKYTAIHGAEPRHDDSYLIEADEDELRAVIVSKGSPE